MLLTCFSYPADVRPGAPDLLPLLTVPGDRLSAPVHFVSRKAEMPESLHAFTIDPGPVRPAPDARDKHLLPLLTNSRP